MKLPGLLLIAVAGCSAGSAAVVADDIQPPSLTGAWDLMMTLERPYELGFSTPAARRVCGTIGFVDADATAHGNDGESDGVYHIPLQRLGLAWLNDSNFPKAVARQSEVERASNALDSVAITLNPESQEHITLRGVRSAGGFNGEWIAQSARGTASGSFALRPYVSGSRHTAC